MDASAWRQEKVRSKKEVILEAQRDKKKVHQDYLTVMDKQPTRYLTRAKMEDAPRLL